MLMKKDDYIADLHLYCDLEQWEKQKDREQNYVQKPTVVPEVKNSRKAGREMKRGELHGAVTYINRQWVWIRKET